MLSFLLIYINYTSYAVIFIQRASCKVAYILTKPTAFHLYWFYTKLDSIPLHLNSFVISRAFILEKPLCFSVPFIRFEYTK